MAHDSEHKSSAELQREIELQRSRVENTIDQIQDKLSPGQLVDELLAYTKGGGGEFLTSLQRRSSTADEYGNTYSEFVDDSGRKFKALSDSSGKRAGHFIDETGSRFKGFTNAAGARIEHFRDEAGNRLDEATGWASHTWQKAREKMHDARDAMNSGAAAGKGRAGQAGDAARRQMESLNQTIITQFREQPLVGGGLAFALGAALGTALPHTPQEDALMGEAADAVKGKAAETAADLYDQGKEKAEELYETASGKAGEVYRQAKDGMSHAVEASGSGKHN